MASNLISPSEYGLLQVPSYSVSFKLFSSSSLYHQTQPSLIFALHGFLSGLIQTFGAVGEVEFSKKKKMFSNSPRKAGKVRQLERRELEEPLVSWMEFSKCVNQVNCKYLPFASQRQIALLVGRFSLVKGY